MSAHGLNLDQVCREINMTNFGRIFAYLALVCMQSDSEESVREHVRKTVEAFRTFHIPKAKRNNKPKSDVPPVKNTSNHVRFKMELCIECFWM